MSKINVQEITIDGTVYVPKSTTAIPHLDGHQYVLVRTQAAGVHIGYLKERNGREVELLSARRIWYWNGAATLSQLAMEGVKRPAECKFSMAVPSILLLDTIEVIPVTEIAKASVEGVKEWKA